MPVAVATARGRHDLTGCGHLDSARSQENVDRFVELIEAINRADIPGALWFMDPEIRFDHRVTALQGVYTGLEDVRGAFTDFTEHFESVQIRCPDVRDLGDRVLALGTTHATGTGVETELPFRRAWGAGRQPSELQIRSRPAFCVRSEGTELNVTSSCQFFECISDRSDVGTVVVSVQ